MFDDQKVHGEGREEIHPHRVQPHPGVIVLDVRHGQAVEVVDVRRVPNVLRPHRRIHDVHRDQHQEAVRRHKREQLPRNAADGAIGENETKNDWR